jgi:hypothetical protein
MRNPHVDADDAGQDREAADRNRNRLVNWGELAATCVASALATLVLSRLGVAGTILGAAVTPVIITLASTVLSDQADRAREVAGQLARKDGRRRLSAALATAAATTGILVAGIALAGAVTDEPIGDWGRESGSGSTSGDRAPARERATPTATPHDGPGSAAKSSPTPAASVRTPAPTPTEPAAPTPTATAPAPSPTAAPSPGATP